MQKIKAQIQIVRPLNCIITFITILVAAYISAHSFEYSTVLVAAFAGALINAGGNIINDYFDIEIDKINRPSRPLPSGVLTVKTALSEYVFLTISALIISYYYLSLVAFAIVLLTAVTMFLYSAKLKGIPLLGNIVVSLSVGLAFIFGSVVVENIIWGIIPASFAFLITLVRELVKDIEDIEGDKSADISTYPIKYGVDATIKIVSILGVILMLSTVLPYFLKIYNLYYFIFVSVFVNGILVFVIRELKRDTGKETLHKASSLLKLGMMLGVISILFGTKM